MSVKKLTIILFLSLTVLAVATLVFRPSKSVSPAASNRMSVDSVDSLSSSKVQQEDEGWRTNFDDKLPLAHLPIISRVESGGSLIVTVENTSNDELSYRCTGKAYPLHYVEDFDNGKWIANRWDWCGTGVQTHTLLPRQKVDFKIPPDDQGRRVRIYTAFFANDKKQAGFVLLCEMGSPADSSSRQR